MQAKLKVMLKKPGYRYLIIGGCVYIFEIAVIVLAQHMGATPAWAVTISFCLGTLTSFFLHKLVTFSNKPMHHKILVPQFIATTLLVIWNLSFSVILTRLLIHHSSAVASRTLAIIITTIWNYYLYKTRIFNKDGSDIYLKYT